MKEFIMVFRNAAMGDFKPTAEQIQAIEKQWADWLGGIAAQGKYVGGTRPAPEGKVISAGNVVTDGPYAEVKEILMGAANIKADSLDEAVEIAKGCPILLVGGNVEVRPVIIMNM
ncbi:YciI family protein [Mucilaginibacter sp.]|uniref:YciI family protein n=1 Tax=Mucilaginibacter sp. TaxID=1882438 RepID=UPI00284830E1|nr:YciI family protein [Mucilaginibacter sp.]MDR3694761.1 YciI family protein [Mucilaginibacter sp.]